MSNVQNIKPKRTCKKIFINYGSYKPYLRDDFNKRCGYCDDLDYFAGGKRGFHIDHFKPKSNPNFSHLQSNYNNLVYYCPFCNWAKSDKWKTNGFIDPCTNEYDSHLSRENDGRIMFTSATGEYIYDNLNLGHRRHQLLWLIDKMKDQNDKISAMLFKLPTGGNRNNLLESFHTIQTWINYCTNEFEATI